MMQILRIWGGGRGGFILQASPTEGPLHFQLRDGFLLSTASYKNLTMFFH